MRYCKHRHKLSVRQACKLFGVHEAVYYYKRRPSDDQKIREELSALAELHTQWGFWMMRYRLKNLLNGEVNQRDYA
ncbi:MAG: hypothetical protein P8O83_04545 [Flavobacteriaceae bacterium]|nr:hypothetical protein [Flavobacteriaceae bacterium]